MPTIDPLNPQLEAGLTRPVSPLLDTIIGALSMDPNSRPIVAGLMNAREQMQRGRYQQTAQLAGQGFSLPEEAPDPTTITEGRSPIGRLAQAMGIVGEPTPRALTPEEQTAVQYGRLQRLKYKTMLEHLHAQNELERARLERLNQQIEMAPREEKRKERKEFLDYSKEFGVGPGTDLLGTLMKGGSLPGGPETYGIGAAQKRAMTGAEKPSKEPSVYVKNRNAFKDAATLKINRLKEIDKSATLQGLRPDQQKERNKLVKEINDLADKYGQPHIDEVPPEPTPGTTEAGGGSFLGGLIEKHPLVRSLENVYSAASSLFGRGTSAAQQTPGARPAATPTPGKTGEIDLGDGFKVRVK